MDCHSNTSISEFLAGLSLLCLTVNAGIVFLMCPQSLHIRFDPIWNIPRMITKAKSSPVPSSIGQMSENNEACNDLDSDSTMSNEKVSNVERGRFYSYFT